MKPIVDAGVRAGTLIIDEATAPIDEHFEVAAWYRRWKPAVGQYPVMKHRTGDGSWALTARVPCICTDAYLGTLYGGLQVGRDTYSQTQVGKTDTLPMVVGWAYKEADLKPWASHHVEMDEAHA